jgi:hypothetical protein
MITNCPAICFLHRRRAGRFPQASGHLELPKDYLLSVPTSKPNQAGHPMLYSPRASLEAWARNPI